MGKAITEASWVGKAAYELNIQTGSGGAWAFQKASQFAREIQAAGLPLSDFDPRSTMRKIYGANDNNSFARAAAVKPTNRDDLDLVDLDIDISGANGVFTLLIIESDMQTLERPSRLQVAHSLAQGIRDALAGREWSLDGIARARPSGSDVVVELAGNRSGKAVALVLSRAEAVELQETLATSAGRPHWSRFATRGLWCGKQGSRRAA